MFLKYEGRVAKPSSIMQVMTLCTGKGGVLEVIYWDCDDDDIADFLRMLSAVPEPTGAGYWSTSLREYE